MDDIPWEGRCIEAAYRFGLECRELRNTNPYEISALETIMGDLATELWDQGFSQTEIKVAFEQAISGLIRYAAGEEQRGRR